MRTKLKQIELLFYPILILMGLVGVIVYACMLIIPDSNTITDPYWLLGIGVFLLISGILLSVLLTYFIYLNYIRYENFKSYMIRQSPTNANKILDFEEELNELNKLKESDV